MGAAPGIVRYLGVSLIFIIDIIPTVTSQVSPDACRMSLRIKIAPGCKPLLETYECLWWDVICGKSRSQTVLLSSSMFLFIEPFYVPWVVLWGRDIRITKLWFLLKEKETYKFLIREVNTVKQTCRGTGDMYSSWARARGSSGAVSGDMKGFQGMGKAGRRAQTTSCSPLSFILNRRFSPLLMPPPFNTVSHAVVTPKP